MNLVKLTTGLAAAAALVASMHAQTISTYSDASGNGFAAGGGTYNDGDLILSFYSASAPNDLDFNIGAVTQFEGLTPGTYQVAGFNTQSNGSADLNATPGLTPGASTFWTVAGENVANSNELFAGSQTSTQTVDASAGQHTGALNIQTFGNAAANNPNADGSVSTIGHPFDTSLGASHAWAAGESPVDTNLSSTSSSLNLFDLVPGHAANELGTFTLTDNAGVFDLTFTVNGQVIPEPSTYAAILGALTVAFVLVRRQLRPEGLSLLA